MAKKKDDVIEFYIMEKTGEREGWHQIGPTYETSAQAVKAFSGLTAKQQENKAVVFSPGAIQEYLATH